MARNDTLLLAQVFNTACCKLRWDLGREDLLDAAKVFKLQQSVVRKAQSSLLGWACQVSP
jgi:hypothetical protein